MVTPPSSWKIIRRPKIFVEFKLCKILSFLSNERRVEERPRIYTRPISVPAFVPTGTVTAQSTFTTKPRCVPYARNNVRGERVMSRGYVARCNERARVRYSEIPPAPPFRFSLADKRAGISSEIPSPPPPGWRSARNSDDFLRTFFGLFNESAEDLCGT